MDEPRLFFRRHALQRMAERKITVEDVKNVLKTGETIASYPEDRPYPSRLILGWIGTRPLHVVVADNDEDNVQIVITVYEPDPTLWEDDFKRRRS
ncbi:hypothetical protein Rhom172_1147 [Rhodothermus marinus SG0.5JP17-172]|uniref:DUF4258 domain-containing protein n=1 Tax=Rhodothermus marinus TaxID=29549 RepID=UPI000223DB42|nr:DUF4258 domain-containing protein [Rhodothermus marinus]AEN73076.1 hypothetical protein Rhom172_1147 [Rhodothermus marinus SG0.5JP17-172]